MADGGFVVLWHSDSDGVNAHDIYARVYGPGPEYMAGIKDIPVNAGDILTKQTPTVCHHAAGSFAAFWYADPPEDPEGGIFGELMTVDGTSLLGEPLHANVHTSSTQRLPAVHPLADGGFIVAWESIGQESGTDIYVQRYLSSGQKVYH